MSVFNSLYAEHYDTFYAEKDYGAECDLIEDAIRRAGGAKGTLLDIGCGTGGHALTLAHRGYRVTGVDLSPHMVEQAREKARARKLQPEPRFVCAGAEDFEIDSAFDAAVMMFAVVGYLTSNAAVLKALRNIRRHVKAGAPFVCDFWYGPCVLSMGPSDRVRTLDTPGGLVTRTTRTTLDAFAHCAEVSITLDAQEGDGRRSSNEVHRLRYFFPQEMALLLGESGFELLSLTAFPSLDAPPTSDTWNVVAVARAV